MFDFWSVEGVHEAIETSANEETSQTSIGQSSVKCGRKTYRCASSVYNDAENRGPECPLRPQQRNTRRSYVRSSSSPAWPSASRLRFSPRLLDPLNAISIFTGGTFVSIAVMIPRLSAPRPVPDCSLVFASMRKQTLSPEERLGCCCGVSFLTNARYGRELRPKAEVRRGLAGLDRSLWDKVAKRQLQCCTYATN
jgi:hypothetical protein